jgi:hypothetical protein
LDSVKKQQVKWLVARAGSPPLRQAATTLNASFFQKMQGKIKRTKSERDTEIDKIF